MKIIDNLNLLDDVFVTTVKENKNEKIYKVGFVDETIGIYGFIVFNYCHNLNYIKYYSDYSNYADYMKYEKLVDIDVDNLLKLKKTCEFLLDEIETSNNYTKAERYV